MGVAVGDAMGNGNGASGGRSAARAVARGVATRSRDGLALPLEQALMERMKELHCLQQIEHIISTSQETIDGMLAEIVTTIPTAWLHPSSAVARIRHGERLYQTGDLERCQSVQSSAIKVNERVCGSVDVGYTDPFEEANEGPFLAEERLLLDTIAIRLGSLIAGELAKAGWIDTLREQELLYRQLVSVLGGMAEMRDPYTAGHQTRVANLAVAIGAELGLSPKEQEGLRLGASVHDIGKITVPAEILCKPTKLTRHEYDLIKEHVEAGYQILKDVAFPWPIARIVYEHHERMDGSGYPNGRTGDQLLPESRIVAVADVVESMCAHRPYRAGLGTEAALAEIEKNRGLLYDPAVVDACLRVFREKGYRCGS
ncbi:HD-GYP domain-containing protein [Synechococcus sp. BA-124 BA4]|jgi:putative nucleotidyltransferase with HDIG domain|uniref:HD-GYP domain-containing protein n=1 Tax=Synechococcus sp. BA-124 BA4 TaxID=3110251 RepID=UPI002B1F0AF7|nr:HD-GYP domain-containing protein [Synechococcus sp. BA-124 BA4]